MNNYTERIQNTKEAFHRVKPTKVNLGNKDYIQTQRQFVVTLYEENTEYLTCLDFLAQIAQWFNVEPVEKMEIRGGVR